MKCKTCQYCRQSSYERKGKQVNMACCILSNYVVGKYYFGGSDWGLFCSHKDMYHHLGRFCDDPCDYYEKK